MIIRTQVSSRRTRKTVPIQQRVAEQLDQQRRERIESCEHWFVRGKCTRCGRIR
jgi:hypothetical protein